MTVTYPADPTKPYGERIEAPRADMPHDEPFVPVYARRGKARGGQGKIKTWMILTPVAVLVLGGIGAMLVLDGGEEVSAPLVEPAATAAVLAATPTDTAVAPLTSASTPEPVVIAPIVAAPVREAAPLRRIAPPAARREAARVPSPTASAQPVTPTPTTTGPQPYAATPAAPATSSLNTAPATPAPTPAPTAPRPVIVIEPAG